MRVVVTGMELISPIGNSVKTFWHSLVSSCSGINTIQNFNTDNYISSRESRRMDCFCQFSVVAAQEAWKDVPSPSSSSRFVTPIQRRCNFQHRHRGGISSWDNSLSPGCDLDYVLDKAREKPITHAISNSFGFGGS